MYPNFKHSFSPVLSQDIETIEKKIATVLPDSYKRFLVKNNGGKPYPGFFKILENPQAREKEIDVHFFLGVDAEQKSLLNSISSFSGRIPSDLLPIGYNGVGDIICLGVKHERWDKVYIWWHEYECEDEDYPCYDNIDMVSESFEAFINGFSED